MRFAAADVGQVLEFVIRVDGALVDLTVPGTSVAFLVDLPQGEVDFACAATLELGVAQYVVQAGDFPVGEFAGRVRLTQGNGAVVLHSARAIEVTVLDKFQ